MKQRAFGFALLTVFLWSALAATSREARATELYQFYRGARAQAMGNAFVAVADDDQALFYNPAGLAGLKGPSFHLLDLDIELNSDLIWNALSYLSLLSNFTPSTLNILIGQKIYGRATGTMSFTTKNVGVAFLYDVQTAFLSDNAALPRFVVGNQWTYGLQAGAGFTVFRWNKKRGELRLGAAAKILWRRGGYKQIPFAELFRFDLGTFDRIAGAWSGPAYGLDLGAQYVHTFKKGLGVRAGVAYTNVGDVQFPLASADKIYGDLSAGVAGTFHSNNFNIILSYDYRNILMDTDWRKKNHIGLQLGIPFLELYAGINQAFLTYGASLDLWVFRLTALSYAEERGPSLFQGPERRYMARITVKFGF